MTRARSTVLALAAVVAAGAAGYWIGQVHPRQSQPQSTTATARAPTRDASDPVIYYQDPDGQPLYSAEPKNTLDGRAYRAVRASEDVSFETPIARSGAASQPAERRVIYYRNPMGLPDVSKAPKKDSMGMDYIPVYEGEDDGRTVKKSRKLQRIGIRPSRAHCIMRAGSRPGRSNDERRIAVVSFVPKPSLKTLRTSPPEARCARPAPGAAVQSGNRVGCVGYLPRTTSKDVATYGTTAALNSGAASTHDRNQRTAKYRSLPDGTA